MYWWERKFEDWWQRPGKKEATDFQRKKIYESERAALLQCADKIPRFESVQEIQKFVDRLVKYAWFERRFGKCTIEVCARREGRQASGYCYGNSTVQIRRGWIKIPTSMFRMDIILHEVVHAVLPYSVGSAHGRLFAKAVLEVYGMALPRSVAKEFHEALKVQYKQRGVKHNPRRQLSDATRQTLRNNFIEHALKVNGAAKECVQ